MSAPELPPPDEQHPAGLQLRRVPVDPRVQLDNVRVEVVGEGRHLRFTVGTGGYDDARRDEIAGRRSDVKQIAGLAQPSHPDAVAHRQVVVHGVGLQVVGHLVLGRRQAALRGEAQAGQLAITPRREQPQRVPAVAPGVTDTRMRVEDRELTAALLQLISRDQAGLAAADDDRLDVFGGVHVRSPSRGSC
jgi:hypothetical protein